MNWIDLIIIIFLFSAIARGAHAGLLQLLLSSVGFVAGLFLGSWAAKHIALHFHAPFTKLMIVLVLEFGLALALGGLGEVLAIRLRPHAMRLHLTKANQVLGAAFEVLFTLLIVWLVASALSGVRSYNIGHDIRGSYIIRTVDSALPTPPDIFAQLEKIISPNGFPNVYLGLEPSHATISPKNSVNNADIAKDQDSVVKIQGIGCGGVVSGSGFVVAKGYVATNAHVVAGIGFPEVIDKFSSYRAIPVWFDPNLDVAILHVPRLTDSPLTLSDRTLPDDDAAAIIGYPGGGSLLEDDAAIIDHVTAVGRNIYNQSIVQRDIYEIQTDVEPGDSGGPLLAPDGTVAGVVFAKSLTQNDVGYALLINQLKPIIAQAQQQTAGVYTSACTD